MAAGIDGFRATFVLCDLRSDERRHFRELLAASEEGSTPKIRSSRLRPLSEAGLLAAMRLAR